MVVVTSMSVVLLVPRLVIQESREEKTMYDDLPFGPGSYVRVKSRPGIAFYIYDWYKTERISGFIDWDERSDFESDFVETSREEIVDKTRAIVTMVGDDKEWVVDTDELEPLSDEDFCGECGQIGCQHGNGGKVSYVNNPDHELTYVEDVTQQFRATVDSNGDVVLVGEAEVLESHQRTLWCSNCGLLDDEEYENHGINECWELA